MRTLPPFWSTQPIVDSLPDCVIGAAAARQIPALVSRVRSGRLRWCHLPGGPVISACAPRALSEASASLFESSRQDCALMPAFELALPSERQQEQNASMSAMREELHQLAIAERLRLTEIATLDHRHFAVVQQKHTPAFILLPSQMSSDRKVGTIKRTSSTHRQGSSALVQYPPPRDFGLRGARSQSHWLPVRLSPGFR